MESLDNEDPADIEHWENEELPDIKDWKMQTQPKIISHSLQISQLFFLQISHLQCYFKVMTLDLSLFADVTSNWIS